MKQMIGSYPMDPLSFLALQLAFRSPLVTSLVEPWLVAPTGTGLTPTSSLDLSGEPLPVLCSKCGYRLGTVEGGWIKPGPCRHCTERSGVPFDKMLGMAFALLGSTLTEQMVLAYLDANPIDASYERVVEARQPILYMQAPVAPTHKLVNLDDGTLDAILNNL